MGFVFVPQGVAVCVTAMTALTAVLAIAFSDGTVGWMSGGLRGLVIAMVPQPRRGWQISMWLLSRGSRTMRQPRAMAT